MTPVSAEEEADVLVFNTCSVRDQAERKALGKVQLMKRLKRRRPEIIIGVVGCMAQNYGEELLKRVPHLDFVLGTDQLHCLPDVLAELETERKQQCLTQAEPGLGAALNGHIAGTATAQVAVMRGCNQFCTYCIVPYVRGREKSRPQRDIVAEVRKLSEQGVREVLLLGQNITAYGVAEERRRDGRWSGASHFADLLRQLDEVEGIERIRFTSPHVRFMTEDFIRAVVDLPSVCESLHVPLQSGSDRVLKAMHRGYTVREYRECLSRFRELCPDMTFSTDIIVGFPGESEEDFERTSEIMRDIGFDMSYIFRYSVRSGTQAEKLGDPVPDAVKDERNKRLLAELEAHTANSNNRYLGRSVDVLVEGPSKRNEHRWYGRTRTNKMCFFEPDAMSAAGTFRTVRVGRTTASSLFGELLPPNAAADTI